MLKKITIVILVGRHLLQHNTWRYTIIQFIMAKKTAYATTVESHFFQQETWRIWRWTLIQFIMIRKITNVTYVERHLLNPLNQETWRYIWIHFIMDKKITKISAHHLKIHIKLIHNGLKDHKFDSCGKAFSLAQCLKRH